MSLTACRECGGQVSGEAATCPHCGVGQPAGIPLPKPAPDMPWGEPVTWLIVLAILVGLPVAYFGWQHFAGGVEADGAGVEQQIEKTFGDLPGVAHVSVTADCPSTVKLRKGKIVDCTLTRDDNGKSTAVYVSGVDNSGHYRMQLGDPFLLVGS